jgi:uncharacterized membrane protein
MRQIRGFFAEIGAALAIVVVVLATSGCTPPELLEAAAADAGTEETGVSEEVAFGEVADVVRGSCSSTPSCHGETGFTNFSVDGDATATDEQVRAAIEDVTTLDGFGMVVSGDAESSALYLRLVETGARKMPPAGQPTLSEGEIETVRLWIEQGASYE